MSETERTGFRSKEYSAWHRTPSIVRFTNGDRVVASRFVMVNTDAIYIEAKHPYDRGPAALAEVGEVSERLGRLDRHTKNAMLTYQLGKLANIPAFTILYKCSLKPNPADPSVKDIDEFYVKELYPFRDTRWNVMTPSAFTRFLMMIRSEHVRIKRKGPQLPFIPEEMGLFLTDDALERRWYSATLMRS